MMIRLPPLTEAELHAQKCIDNCNEDDTDGWRMIRHFPTSAAHTPWLSNSEQLKLGRRPRCRVDADAAPMLNYALAWRSDDRIPPSARTTKWGRGNVYKIKRWKTITIQKGMLQGFAMISTTTSLIQGTMVMRKPTSTTAEQRQWW